MIVALLAAASLTASPPSLQPLESTRFERRQIHREWVARVTPTRFFAVNSSDNTQLMLLGTPQQGVLATLVLPPRGEVDASFPAGTLDGLYVEVLVHASPGWVSTGAMPLDVMSAPEAGLVWVDSRRRSLTSHMEVAGATGLLHSEGTLDPGISGPTTHAASTSGPAPPPEGVENETHVPVPPHGEGQQGDTPPDDVPDDPPPPV